MFRLHREKVIRILKSHKIHKSFVVFSPHVPREYYVEDEKEFFQEPLFYYLSGWKYPNSCIYIDMENNKSILFTQDFDDEYILWSGPRIEEKVIKDLTGVDEVFEFHEFNKVMEQKSHEFMCLDPNEGDNSNQEAQILLTAAAISRRIKFNHEIESCRKASIITSNAIIEVMKACKPGINERVLEAVFRYQSTIMGGHEMSFPPIIASGEHSYYLHYTQNNGIVPDNSLVLIDVGVKYDSYCGDVSRTIPSNGKFSNNQKLVYNAVLGAQLRILNRIKAGITLFDADSIMQAELSKALIEIGICPKGMSIDEDLVSIFCPHSVSHHIGLNNHDLFFINKNPFGEKVILSYRLAPGMIISVEPGLYFQPEIIKRKMHDYPEINWNTAFEYAIQVGGIRIEDDILITDNGIEVLSNCPKTVDDIEKIMNKETHQG